MDDSSVSLDDDKGMKKFAIHFDYTSRSSRQFGFFVFSLQITMAMNEQNLQALCTYLRQTLSANATERSEGKFIVHSSTSLIDRFSGENIETDRTQRTVLVIVTDTVRSFDDAPRCSSCFGDHLQEFHQTYLALIGQFQCHFPPRSQSHQGTHRRTDDTFT